MPRHLLLYGPPACGKSTAILRAAYEAGINFYDTANAYTDSEFKLGQALGDVRRNIIIATKTAPAAPEVMQQHLEQSLKMLRTDYIDIYQLHCAPRVYRPGEEDGVYDWLLQKKREGAIRHISVTAHRIGVAEEALESGLYDTLQYPFSVIADERELRLAQRAKELDIGFIAMKAMGGGLIQHPEVTFAFLRQYPQVKVTSIARGIGFGDELEYVDELTITHALMNRREIE